MRARVEAHNLELTSARQREPRFPCPVGCAHEARGEAIITDYGIEGGAIYARSAALRDALAHAAPVTLSIDLRPALSEAEIEDRELQRPQAGRKAGLPRLEGGATAGTDGGGGSPDDLRATWWAEQHEGKQALTQAIGRLAKHLAFQGILAPSARVAGLNLMLFRERVSDRELTIVNPDAFPLARRRLRR